jgi:hypothetical protein
VVSKVIWQPGQHFILASIVVTDGPVDNDMLFTKLQGNTSNTKRCVGVCTFVIGQTALQVIVISPSNIILPSTIRSQL